MATPSRSAIERELPGDPEALARGHDRQAFARLVAALIRSSLAKDRDEILKAAS